MKTFICLCFGLLLGFMVGCNDTELKSHWRDREITIDGNNDEWHGAMWRLEKENVVVGVMNDDKFAYLTFTISDRAYQRQIAMQGMTVWFDRKGGDEKKFGIHYQVGRGMMDMERRRPMDEHDRDSVPAFPEQISNEIEILGPMEGDHSSMTVQELKDIGVGLRFSQGLLVYELKVPLMDNGPQPYAIGTTAGSAIGIGVETGSFDFAGRRGGGGLTGGGGGGGFGGRRGGRGGGFGGGSPSGMRE